MRDFENVDSNMIYAIVRARDITSSLLNFYMKKYR